MKLFFFHLESLTKLTRIEKSKKKKKQHKEITFKIVDNFNISSVKSQKTFERLIINKIFDGAKRTCYERNVEMSNCRLFFHGKRRLCLMEA
jgi:hypothetical protein